MDEQNEKTLSKDDLPELELELSKMKAEINRSENRGSIINVKFYGNTRLKRRPIIQYSLDGKCINSFSSMHSASKITNTSTQLIWKCCNNLGKTGGGFIWKYRDLITS